MLMSNATKGIKKVVLTIDRKVFKPIIDRVIDWNFSKKNDMSIVGDVNIVSTGVVALMAKEQVAERRLSYLRDTANPVDSQILGLTGRAALHREIVKTLEISGSTIIPSDEVIEERQREERESQQAQQRQAQMQMQMEQQVQQADVQSQQRGDQREDAKVQISATKTEGEMQLKREELKIKGMLASQKGIETGAKAGMLEAQTMDTIIGGNGVENDSGI